MLKKRPIYEFIGEVILKININVQGKKIKAEVYLKQDEFLMLK
jgi:hypothetical protein